MSSNFVSANGRNELVDAAIRHWPLLAGLAVLCIPVLVEVGEQAWTRETGVHGPIILATWLWLLYRGYDENRPRSEEHPSELPSLIRISYAVFCLKKKRSYR